LRCANTMKAHSTPALGRLCHCTKSVGGCSRRRAPA